MKKFLLASFIISTGVFSLASAQSSIPGRIDGDLYFHDEVFVSSGVTYQSSLSEEGGESSVTFDGEGSLTIGNRLGNGFPRVILYGGTSFKVAQDFGGKEKNWWAGKIKAPNRILNLPYYMVDWENTANHVEGETKVASSFGFELSSETYLFSPSGYVVLPVNAPDNAKVWYVFHDIDTNNCNATSCVDKDNIETLKVKEDDFCIVKDGLCVVEVEEMNQISFIEESFQRCPREEVANGDIGAIPYCILTCNSGYELDENAVACVKVEGSEEEVAPTAEQDTSEASQEEPAQEKQKLRSARMHYTGASSVLELIDTSNLSGDALRNALRRNAEINKRRNKSVDKDKNGEVSTLAKAINNIKQKLWSWENQKSGVTIAAVDKEQEIALNEGQDEGISESESLSGHASAPLLPSTGSSSMIFIIISILGIGLMMMALKRR